ncbi:MAG TPA: hypothetical protein VJM11_03660 [Nevskiaceae bacterium]|nr:hypothetical protein [Nevskiaceae bacterium]
MCEEFHCLPSEAYREAQRLPVDLLETILAFRAYARAKAAYDREGLPPNARPAHPLADVVQRLAFALVQEPAP